MAAVDFCELILEETPRYEGAVTTAPYRLSSDKLYMPVKSARLGPGVQYKDRSDELRSIAGAVPKIVETFQPDGSIAENAYIHDLTWLLAIAGFTGTHTAGDGAITDPDGATIPVGAHRWVFNKTSGITAQTAQLRNNYADEAVLLTGQGYAASQVGLNAAGDLTASLDGLVLKRNAVDTTTVPVYATSTAQWPIRSGDLYLTWLGSGGVVSDFSFQIANAVERVRTLSLATPSNYPDLMEFGDAQVQVTGSIPKRVLAAADYDALLAATTFAAKARWVTPKVIGATAYKYSMWVDMPAAMYSGGNADEIGNKRRFGASFDFEAAYSEGSGYDCRITLVNDVASIYTWA